MPRDDTRRTPTTEQALAAVRRELDDSRTRLANRGAAHAHRHKWDGADPIEAAFGALLIPYAVMQADAFALTAATTTKLRYRPLSGQVARVTASDPNDEFTADEPGWYDFQLKAAADVGCGDFRTELVVDPVAGAPFTIDSDETGQSGVSWTWARMFAWQYLNVGDKVWANGWVQNAVSVKDNGRQRFSIKRLSI